MLQLGGTQFIKGDPIGMILFPIGITKQLSDILMTYSCQIFSILSHFTIHRFTLPDRLEIIKKYYQNFGSIVAVSCEFHSEHGRHYHFNNQIIRHTVDKLEREYTLLDLKPPTRARTGRSEENIVAVAASLEEDNEPIDSASFSCIRPLERDNTAYSEIGFGPAFIQNGVDSRTEAE